MKSRLASILILLSVAILLGSSLSGHAVSNRTEDSLYWVSAIKNPDRLLLSASEIRKMNEENLKKRDLLLCRVEEMKGEWTRGEILSFLKEDGEDFRRIDKIRYGKHGNPPGDSSWNEIKENINQIRLKERNQLLFALTIQRTDIRVFPTDEASRKNRTCAQFDLFQHSAIAPGSLVGVYHFSQDNLWAYAQTSFIRGWIRTKDLAFAKNREEALGQPEQKDPLVITGNSARVFGDPLFLHLLVYAQMGTTFPILHLPDPSKTTEPYYVVRLPVRGSDGQLTFRDGFIPADDDVHYGFLAYTQKNLARQAFKMLHQPYGWGEMSGGRDCSRFIMDLFNTFGVLMPRNSTHQARMGVSLEPLDRKTVEEKRKILDRTIPLATLLRIPGHIMLYLGKDNGVHYAIHSISGIQKEGKSGPVYQKFGKVVVTDLDLGKGSPGGSLLQRLTEIQFIGPTSEVKK